MGPSNEDSRLVFDDGTGTRVRVSQETLKRIEQEAAQLAQQQADTNQSDKTNWSSELIFDRDGTRIRVSVPKPSTPE
jgi:hypothetical protein